MEKRRITVALLTASAASVLAVSSEPVVVDCDGRSPHWMTVHTNQVALRWDWMPAGTTGAELSVAGMNGSFTTHLAGDATGCVWQAFAGDRPPGDDVHEVTLTLYTDGGQAASVHTARLAVLAGAFGPAAVDTGAGDWGKVGDSAVIPYDPVFADGAAGAASARLAIAKEGGGPSEARTLTPAAGYAGWKLAGSGWGYGEFSLELTFPGTGAEALAAALRRCRGGTLLSVK
jgi:hypothetical protein